MTSDVAPTSCYVCAGNGATDNPPREEILRTSHWRVAHAFNSTLPGWLVLLPLRHVDSFAELSATAMAELGRLTGAASRALHTEVGCTKTYAMQFSEAAGFHHLHVHLVPRMPDLPQEHRGPAIFHYLSRPESEWLPASVTDELAERLAPVVARELSG